MKLVEILSRPEFQPGLTDNVKFVGKPKRNLKIKQPVTRDVGNDGIVYLGTDAIQRSFSSDQPSKVRRIKRPRGKGETMWLDNPTATPCSSCGY